MIKKRLKPFLIALSALFLGLGVFYTSNNNINKVEETQALGSDNVTYLNSGVTPTSDEDLSHSYVDYDYKLNVANTYQTADSSSSEAPTPNPDEKKDNAAIVIVISISVVVIVASVLIIVFVLKKSKKEKK